MSQSGKKSGGKKREDAGGVREDDMPAGNGEKGDSGAKSEKTSLNGEGEWLLLLSYSSTIGKYSAEFV